MLRSTDLLAPDVAAKAIPANNASQPSPTRATNAPGTVGRFLSLEWPKITRRDLAYQLLGYERHNRAATEQALGLIGQGQLDLTPLVPPIACRSIGTTKASNPCAPSRRSRCVLCLGPSDDALFQFFVVKSIYRRLCKCRHCGNTIGEFL
jgi:hypothetical protein